MMDKDAKKTGTKKLRSRLQAGNAIVMLFAAIGMAGVVTYSLNNVIRGPAVTTAEVSRRTMAENNLIATTRLAISAASQQAAGDCDDDGFIEPVPYRAAGGAPAPVGGGLVPSTIGASMADPWGVQYGYCVWDPGTASVSDAVAACGGATPRRLEGAPRDDQYAIAVISAGKNGAFETSCNAYVDTTPADGVPDTVMLNKPAGSDDVVLAYSYAEANGIGGGEWKLKAADPTTAEIGKNLEIGSAANPRGATFNDGALTMSGARGLVLPGDPGDDTVTGACNADKDSQLRRNIGDGSDVPVIEICHDNTWTPVTGGSTVGQTCTADYDTWTAHPSAGSRNWSHVEMSADGQTLAAILNDQSEPGYVYYSHDGGATWDNGNVFALFSRLAVSSDGNVMYTAGSEGVRKSVDGGATWAAPTSTLASAIAMSSDGQIVATANWGGTLRVSTNGSSTWTARAPSRQWFDMTVSSNGTRMAATVYSGFIYTSSDSGTTWTQRATTNTWRHIAASSDGMRLVAHDDSNRIWTSADAGANWTQQLAAPSVAWWNLASSSDGMTLVGTVSGGQIYTSEDAGVTWTASGINRDWRGVAMSADGTKVATTVYGSTILTAYGNCAGTGTGDNAPACGEDWEPQTTPASTLLGVTYGAGRYVATGTNLALYSINGENWVTAPSVPANGWISATYANGLFVAVSMSGNTSGVMTSTDGINWTARTTVASDWTSIAYGNGVFVAVARAGANRVMTSTDGITWTARTAAQNNSWQRVAYGNGVFVAVSSDGTNRVMTSPDGVTWTARNAAAANAWETITYGNGLFVALSTNGTNRVMRSADGITWTGSASPVANTWRGITYGNGRYVAVSESGIYRVMTSTDGITWLPQETAQLNQWEDITYADGKYVAVSGDGGTTRIMTSTCGSSVSDTITTMPHPLDEGLIAHWKLDEATGTAVTDSVGNNDGVLVNTPIWAVEGPHGTSSLNLRKDDRDAVQINGLLGQPSDGTIAAWVNIESMDTWGTTIFSIGDNISLVMTPADGLRLSYWDGSTTRSTSSADRYNGTGWHYVVATFSSTNDAFRLYVDGTSIGSTTATQNISWTPRGANTFIGRHGNANTNFDLDGSVDDVRVYGRALSPNEVVALTERAKNETLLRDVSYSTQAPVLAGQLSVGGEHACAINKDKGLWCWGSNTSGKLGNTNFGATSSVPVSLMASPSEWVDVAAGTDATCAIRTDETLWCWGGENAGQFGNGGGNDGTVPLPFSVTPAMRWSQISMTYQHACGITTAGALYCWGSNVAGKLGNGNTTQQFSPVQIGTDRWKFVSAGYHHTCGIKADGSGWCWGDDANGRLGNGAALTGSQSSPSPIEGGHVWSSISAKSNEFTCGVTKDGMGWCWGSYANGKLGNGTVGADQVSPLAVSDRLQWKEIITETGRACGVTVNGAAYCWGLDTNGELGNGATTGTQWTPNRVLLPNPVSTLQLGYDFACAMEESGRVWCWGGDDEGQLGNGAALTGVQTAPTSVVGFPNPSPFLWNSAHNNIRLNPGMTIALGNKWLSDDGTARYFGFDGPGIAKLAQTSSSNQLLVDSTFANSSAQMSFRRGDPAVPYVDTTASAIFWTMDETSGTAVPSSSANAYPGTISGRAVWNATGGITSPSLEFDGSTGRVSVANNAAFRPAGSYAIAVLIRPDGAQAAGATILSKSYNNGQYDSYALKFTSDQRISFVTTGTGPTQHVLTSTQAVRPNAWTIVTAFSVDTGGGTASKGIAINNVVDPYVAALNPIYSTDATGNLFFGAGGCAAPCNGFKGSIDGVRLYGIELTSAVFQQIYGFQSSAFAIPKTIGVDYSTNSIEIGTNNAAASNWLDTIAPEFSLPLAGNVGIGTATPAAKVDVAGGVRVGYQTTCAAGSTGTLRYTGNTRDILSGATAELCQQRMGVSLYHGCAIGNNKKAYCWGLGTNGRLGDGTGTSSTLPVTVANGAGPGTYKTINVSKMEYLADGAHFACGIGTDDRAYCWGNNGYGQLGDNTTTTRTTPVLVLNGAGPGTYKSISVGTFHVCAIGTDDRAYCWGNNSQGELGDNTLVQRNTPTLALNGVGPGTYKRISAGQNSTCGIGTDDRAYCWGNNGNRQLADGTTTDRRTPILPNQGAGPGTYVSISMGEDHGCAVGTDARAYCWGAGTGGWLGNGGVGMQGAPALVSNGDSSGTFKSISSGRTHTCAIGTDNKGYCWGDNTYGQIGDNTTGQRNVPELVLNGDSMGTYKEIVAGERASCGLGPDNRLYCWGDNTNGQLADGTTTQRNTPILALSGYGPGRYDSCPGETTGSYEYCNGTTWGAVGGTSATISTLWSKKEGSLTTQHASCSIRHDGSAWCWGNDVNERLGNGPGIAEQHVPARVVSTAPWRFLSAGDNHTCGILKDGLAYCWGGDGNGQLGNGAPTGMVNVPQQINSTDTWADISGGYRHTCGIKNDGTSWCWGSDVNGRLGNGAAATSEQASPSLVDGTGTWLDVEAGVTSTCGIKNDGTAWCWGDDTDGQLGNGATAGNQVSPSPVDGTGTWIDITVGNTSACGIKNDGSAWCWGDDTYGKLGNSGITGTQISPSQVAGTGTWIHIDAGHLHACGIKNDGTGWCWGNNTYGQLGSGISTFRNQPYQIDGGGTWVNLLAGERVTCGTRPDGTNWCWGSDQYGELGNGTVLTVDQVTPTMVQ